MVTPDQIVRARSVPLLSLLGERVLRKTGGNYMSKCDFHNDKTPSMSIFKGDDGLFRFKCHGCGATGDSIKYLQLKKGMSFVDAVEYLIGEAKTAPMTTHNKPVKTYDYYDERGVLLYQVQRFEPKTFRCRRPDDEVPGKWHWDLCGVRRVLYRLPALLSKPAGSTVYFCEGEKDVESCEAKGLVATTHAGGATSYRSDLLKPISHLRIVVIPDLDDIGKQLMRRVFSDARAAKQEVGFAILPSEYKGKAVKDVTDFFEAGGTKEELEGMVK